MYHVDKITMQNHLKACLDRKELKLIPSDWKKF